MKAWGVLALAGCMAGFGCAKPGSPDPTPVFASQADLAQIRQAISPCLKRAWAASTKARAVTVTVKWQLDEEGTLVDDPAIVAGAPPDSPAAQTAIKAVRTCAPYRLPLDKYDLWKEIVYNFDATT